MRYLPILTILIFFSTILDASYARSIRVGSFLKEKHAEKELIKLENFVESNHRLSQLKDKYHFEVKLLIRGKYYLNVIEPLMKKTVVQEILDILRTKYSYVYPKKIRYLPEYAHYGEKKEVIVKEEEEEVIDDSELMEKVDQILQNGKIEENETPTRTIHKTNHLQKMAPIEEEESSFFDMFSFELPNFFGDDEVQEEKEIPKPEVIKVVEVQKHQDSSNSPLTVLTNHTLETLLAIAILILLVLLRFYIKYKKESKNKISMQDIYS